MFRSLDGGATWEKTLEGHEALAIALSPDFDADRTLFAGGRDGVFTSTDGGDTWERINEGLFNTSVWALAVSRGYGGVTPYLPVPMAAACFAGRRSSKAWNSGCVVAV